MAVATAIVGSAIVGGVLGNKRAKEQGKAVEGAADASAEATIESTRMQLEELSRQFDTQMQILAPMVQQQYNAQQAYSDLLGIGGPQVPQGTSETDTTQTTTNAQDIAAPGTDQVTSPGFPGGDIWSQDWRDSIANYLAQQQGDQVPGTPADTGPNLPQAPGPGATTFTRDDSGAFVDPNLTPDTYRGTSRLGVATMLNQVGGMDPEADAFRNYIRDNAVATGDIEDDLRYRRSQDETMTGIRGRDTLTDRVGGTTLTGTRGGDTITGRRGADSLSGRRGGVSLADQRGGLSLLDQRGGENIAEGAAGTGVYGDVFQESPGYAFALEQMDRATDRMRSRGGNYGGRAMLEAQRRAKGLADQEYYTWAAGRERDLGRLGAAEAADIGRRDRMAEYDIGRGDQLAQYDIGRGDIFAQFDVSRLDDFAGRDIGRLDEFGRYDIGRGDDLARYDIGRADRFAETDLARGDSAVDAYEQQRLLDQQRGDQAYQNWLGRRERDVERGLDAVRTEDSLAQLDIQRQDQAYYNYLNQLASMAGFGNPAGQAVDVAGRYGSDVADAYGSQGGRLASIYSQLGANQANITGDEYATYNNAVQSGLGNWITARAAGLI